MQLVVECNCNDDKPDEKWTWNTESFVKTINQDMIEKNLTAQIITSAIFELNPLCLQLSIIY